MFKIVLPAVCITLNAEAAVLLNDSFDNNDPLTNSGSGYTGYNTSGWQPAESGGSLSWGGAAGWGWGGADYQSNDEFFEPAPGTTQRITWAIGPMSVTTPSPQSWGDVRMQLSLVSANLPQGSSSSETWPMTQGIISVDIILKQGQPLYASLHTKDSSVATNANGTYQGVTNNLLDPAVDNIISLDLTASDISMTVNGQAAGTFALSAINFGWGAGEEFENGWFPALRGAVVDSGQGAMSIKSMLIEEITAVPEPASTMLGLISLAGLGLRRRRLEW